MEKDENRALVIKKEDGTEILCEILFTTYDENFKKNYVVFEIMDDEGQVSAAVYEPSEDGEGKLSDIETDEEWEMIEEMLNKFVEEQEEHNCGCGCNDDDCECDQEHEHCGCGCSHEDK